MNYAVQFSDWLRQRLSSEGTDDPITEVLLFENDDKLVRSLAEVIDARRDAVAPIAELAQADFDTLQDAIRKYHAWYTKLGIDEAKAASFDDGFPAIIRALLRGLHASNALSKRCGPMPIHRASQSLRMT